MGALLAGVFCGVLHHEINQYFPALKISATNGAAVGRSSFLLRMGSDMLTISY